MNNSKARKHYLSLVEKPELKFERRHGACTEAIGMLYEDREPVWTSPTLGWHRH